MIKGIDFTEGEFFRFPLTSQGLEWFQSISDMRQTYARLFQNLYGSNVNIKWFLVSVRSFDSSNKTTFLYSRRYNKEFNELLKISCKICSNTIVYGRIAKTSGYSLIHINYYHLHTNNLQKYLQFLKTNQKLGNMMQILSKRQETQQERVEQNRSDQIISFYSKLSNKFTYINKLRILTQNFGLKKKELEVLVENVDCNSFQNEFSEMILKFKRKNIKFSYLPKDILQEKMEEEDRKCFPQEQKDTVHPNLPNILIISTPEMKEQYKRFGILVGFDLTFNLISERAENDREYMIGVFASTNLFKKIIIFGLVVTNSQSVFAYTYIFREFFNMMGADPLVIVTDEEKGMYQALKRLKQRGEFKGRHFFDMFHILRKFRKCSTKTETFHLVRKMIHAKNKVQYRRLFKLAMKEIINEKELETLRSFDLNSQNYAFSQIEPGYVGLGVSNSTNEFFHHLLKSEIPYATRYTKAVQLIIDVIEKRIAASQIPYLEKSFMEKLNISGLNELTRIISDKSFQFVLKQISKSPLLHIVNYQEEQNKNLFLRKQAIDDENNGVRQRERFFLEQNARYYMVFKEEVTSEINIKRDKYKWSCLCGFQEKSGFLCYHTFKVLSYLDQSLLHNIRRRWQVLPEDLDRAFFIKELSLLKMNGTVEKRFFWERDQTQNFEIENISERYCKEED